MSVVIRNIWKRIVARRRNYSVSNTDESLS